MNLMLLARSGLSSAQSALNVVGNNITNAFTPGYSRQSILLGEAGGKATSQGFFGYGVQVNDVTRAYDSFVSNQTRGAETVFMMMSSRYEMLSGIDDLFGDVVTNLGVAMDDVFTSMEAVSKDATDTAARSTMLAELNAMVNQFNSNSNQLNNLEKNTNTKIRQSVNDINSLTTSLAELNKEIYKAQAQSGGTVPPDLLDQRDTLLSELNCKVGVKVDEDPHTGVVNVTMNNGISLVNGDRAYALDAQPDPANPSQLQVCYIDASENHIPLDESKMQHGELAGLLKFRRDDLTNARNQLNQLALQLANKYNEVNRNGYDLNGEPGGDLFSFDVPGVLANQRNQGDASLSMRYDDVSSVQARDYVIRWQDGAWQVETAAGEKIDATVNENGELVFDGIAVQLEGGTPQEGDSFMLNPTRNVASTIKVAIDDGDLIAAASEPGEESNNENIKDLIAIKDEKLIGNATLSEAYATLVSDVGAATSELKTNLKTQAAVVTQYQKKQQSVAGVDVYEEYVNLQMYQQYYQANAQLLKTATTLFDTILSLR